MSDDLSGDMLAPSWPNLVYCIFTRAATILRLLGNETIQSNTRGKKSEQGIRKQLNIDVKSTTKLNFFFKYINIFIYFTNIRCFRFRFIYFKHLCNNIFIRGHFNITNFKDASNLTI